MTENLKLALDEPLIAPLVPQGARAKMAVLWDVHAKLAALSISGKEPALRQIRLAWWRDSFAALRAGKSVPAEPLLQAVASELLDVLSAPAMADLAEARLQALAGEWDPPDIVAYGRQLFALSATVLGQPQDGGAAWALVETALALDDQRQASSLLAAAAAMGRGGSGPRALVVLDRLACAIAARDGKRSRGREQLLVLRVGLLGR
jgi:15-cis-phytoene synthase